MGRLILNSPDPKSDDAFGITTIINNMIKINNNNNSVIAIIYGLVFKLFNILFKSITFC